MSVHMYPLEKYSLLVKSTMSFKKTFNEITDVRLEVRELEASLPWLKILNARNQELESHLIDPQMQCWQKERSELWFKILSKSQIKRFKAEFRSEEHCTTIIAILQKFGIEIKRSPNFQPSASSNRNECLSTQAFIQDESQIVPVGDSYQSQLIMQVDSASLSQPIHQESPSTISPFQFSQPEPPFKNWKFSPLLEEDLVFPSPEPIQSSGTRSIPSQELPKSESVHQIPFSEDLLVEKVLAKRRVDGTLQYLLKWSGISKEYATWKDYTSCWPLEDQQKALAFEKSLLEEVVEEEDAIIPYIVDLDLIRLLIIYSSNATLQKWVETQSGSANVACIIAHLTRDKEKWRSMLNKIF